MVTSTADAIFELRPQPFSKGQMIQLGHHWAWILVTGIIYIALGTFAFTMPIASTFGITMAIGVIAIIAGVVHLVQAIRLRKEVGTGTRFLQSFLSVIVGGLMLRWPEGGMFGLALLLSFYFFVSAATQWILFSAVKPIGGYVWGLLSSILTFCLGAFIIFTFPLSALWVPGALFGIDLFFAGAAMIGLALSVRHLRKEISTVGAAKSVA